MSATRNVVCVLLLLLSLAWASVMLRYDLRIIANPDGDALAYRLDRWTGVVRLIEEDQWFAVEQGSADEPRDFQRRSKGSNL
jgi:hypothetical protein